jgi:hypothetical protein
LNPMLQWHLLFRLFIRSIEYPYERVVIDYAKLTNFKPFSGKVSRWL